MSPIITTVAWPATLIAAHGCGLLGPWLRLRWRARQEQVHRRYVVTIAQALPAGSQIDEGDTDGRWLKLAIAPAPPIAPVRRSEGTDG
ncbi:MAG: hypothetical protein ACRDUV_12380 [Pseudonocardiaceae bacterium]